MPSLESKSFRLLQSISKGLKGQPENLQVGQNRDDWKTLTIDSFTMRMNKARKTTKQTLKTREVSYLTALWPLISMMRYGR